jgi:anaerobic ribonucleoside-triphosphate reductase activating protein
LEVLNIAAVLRNSAVNGPGNRYVVWTQGCTFKCEGCLNPEFQPLINRCLVPVDELARRILSTECIEGVTYTGGEPLLQAKALAALSEILRTRGLTLVCYTGFTLDQLQESSDLDIKTLLGLLDVLIDGQYLKAEKANLLWRGSANQKVHFITDIYSNYGTQVNTQVAEMEMVFDNSGMAITGILQDTIVARLTSQLMDKDKSR